MGIFPMNILARSHSPTLYHAAVAWILNEPPGPVVDVEVLVLLGSGGKLCLWEQALEGDVVSLTLIAFILCFPPTMR